MAALEAAVTMPDCAREGCGHSHGRHRKTRNKKQLILKCAEPGCTCRHYLEPNEDGTPRRTSPTAGQKYPAEILTPDEIAAMIALCSSRYAMGIRDRALLTLFYRSGLRLAEAVGDRDRGVMGIRAADIDFAGNSIRVLHGKGDKATTRYFHPSATDALVRWIEMRKKMGIAPGGPLFCTIKTSPPVEPGPRRPKGSPGRPAGSPIHPQQVRNLVHALAAEAGIEKRVHPHALRHTFAVELMRAGVPLDVISGLLGHESVATTAAYLRHLVNADAGRALQDVTLPGLLGGRVPGERVLEITRERNTAGMSEWHGSCAACGMVFETNHPGTAGEVRNFLMGAFQAHECRLGRVLAGVREAPKGVSRPPATAACGECGAPTLPVRLDGCLARHQVKTGSSAVAWCEGGGKPPAGAGKPAVPAWARKVTLATAPALRTQPAKAPEPIPQKVLHEYAGTCSACGAGKKVRADGNLPLHHVKTASGSALCEGGGFPPLEAVKAVMPVVAELVGMLEDQQREEGL